MSHHHGKKHCKKECKPKCEPKCTRYCEWSNSCEDPCPVTTEKREVRIVEYRSKQNQNCCKEWGHTEKFEGCWEKAPCQPGRYQKKDKCHKKHH